MAPVSNLSRPLWAVQALRRATAAAHEEVDALFSPFDLSGRADYCAFLFAQARAHLPVEAALDSAGAERVFPDWDDRRRAGLLRADLADLGQTVDPAHSPAFVDDAEIAGAAYVLEGSRLGAALLRRTVGDGLPVRFLSASTAPGAWRDLMLRLDDVLDGENRLARAIGSATAVFALFAAAGREVVEPARG